MPRIFLHSLYEIVDEHISPVGKKFKKFRKAVKRHHKRHPQIEDLY